MLSKSVTSQSRNASGKRDFEESLPTTLIEARKGQTQLVTFDSSSEKSLLK